MFISIRTLAATLLAAFALNAFAAVDVNQANQAELEGIKGIGPSLSTKIIDARKTAAFKDWNDMVERVAGVGPASAARLSQAGLTVGGSAYTPVPAAPKADKPVRAPRPGTAATTADAGKAAK